MERSCKEVCKTATLLLGLNSGLSKLVVKQITSIENVGEHEPTAATSESLTMQYEKMGTNGRSRSTEDGVMISALFFFSVLTDKVQEAYASYIYDMISLGVLKGTIFK